MKKINIAGRSFDVNDQNQILNKFGRPVRPFINEDGYVQYCFSINGKRFTLYEHRLVWMLNKGEIPEGMTVDHIDGVKTNNEIDNLQLLSRGENAAKSKSKIYQVLSPQGALFTVVNLRAFCRLQKLDSGNMIAVAKGRAKQHKGWRVNEIQRD